MSMFCSISVSGSFNSFLKSAFCYLGVEFGRLVAVHRDDLLEGPVAVFREADFVLPLLKELLERRSAIGLSVDLDLGGFRREWLSG